MSERGEVATRLDNLVSWCDQLGELQALDSFLVDAIVNIAEGDGLAMGRESVTGLYLFCADLSRRVDHLKTQMQVERRRLQQELRSPCNGG